MVSLKKGANAGLPAVQDKTNQLGSLLLPDAVPFRMTLTSCAAERRKIDSLNLVPVLLCGVNRMGVKYFAG